MGMGEVSLCRPGVATVTHRVADAINLKDDLGAFVALRHQLVVVVAVVLARLATSSSTTNSSLCSTGGTVVDFGSGAPDQHAVWVVWVHDHFHVPKDALFHRDLTSVRRGRKGEGRDN